ncbi:hypothetical protein RRG08_046578 [Elysia crispata]|uniref:Uncharacterized protein n=1 Tax=Elysia crispata TaxID=231223 RepID=A0AAE1AQE7_9GAST|nr:hypothetical protein RRG08_046578 [Elysia crispata]
MDSADCGVADQILSRKELPNNPRRIKFRLNISSVNDEVDYTGFRSMAEDLDVLTNGTFFITDGHGVGKKPHPSRDQPRQRFWLDTVEWANRMCTSARKDQADPPIPPPPFDHAHQCPLR